MLSSKRDSIYIESDKSRFILQVINMLSNEEPCENLDELYSTEDEENGTDPTYNQQRGRKQRK